MMALPQILLVMLGVLGAFSLFIAAIQPSRQERRFRERVGKVQAGAARSPRRPGSTDSLRKEQARGLPGFERLAKLLLPRPEKLRERLIQAGLTLSIGMYFVFNMVIGLVLGSLARFGFDWPVIAAVATGIFGGIALPYHLTTMLTQRRAAQFNAIFPDAIDLIVRGLKSGLPVAESINAVGREMLDPVGAEFRRVVDLVKFGEPLEDALWQATKRIAAPEFKFFAIALSVQKDTGGNLGETLSNLSEILRSRRQMRLKIKAMSSEARASAMILGSLPFIMFGIIYVMNPDYESLLFTDPRGKIILGFALGLMAVGVLVMRKMVKFEI